jgi:tetratricopeptide (TPR) repeat protein
MKYFSAILSIVVITGSFAQDRETDSLRHCVATQTDTLRINSMVKLAQRLRSKSPDEAEGLFKQALADAERLDHWKGKVRVHNSIGILYGIRGDYPMALDHFKQGLLINEERHFNTGLADSYSNMGIVYKRIGNYPLSLQHYRQALEIYQRINDYKGIAAVYQNMAVLHDLMNELEQSYQLYRKAYAIEDSLQNKRGMAIVTGNIGIYHMNKKQFSAADEHFRLYLQLAHELQDKGYVSDALQNLGNSQAQQGNATAAMDLFTESLAIAVEMGNRQSLSTLHYSLGDLELQKKNYAKALEHATTSLKYAENLSSIQHIMSAQLLLSRVVEASGNHQLALEHHKRYSAWKDSLLNDEKVRQFKAQQVQFEVMEKDNALASQRTALALLTRDVEWKQRWLMLLIGFLVMSVVALVLVIIQVRHRKRSNELLTRKNQLILEQKREIETLNTDLEKRMLRAQMNPHFIFNALSSIQHFITLNDKSSALRYLSRFSHLLRQVLETSIDGTVILAEEIELLRIYLELESLRFDGSFSFELGVDPSLDPSAIEVPVLLYQPFIENAVLHGLVAKEGEKKLSVRFGDDGEQVTCTIIDNGIGREAAAQRRGHREQPSRGLSVTAKRLALLEKNRNVKTDIIINDLVDPEGNPAGTQVDIKLPKS